MNSDRQRHSSCSRLPPLRSRYQTMRAWKFAAPSLSVSSPWRQREDRKWRCAALAGEAPLKITVTAAVPAQRQTENRSLETLWGCAKMWEWRMRCIMIGHTHPKSVRQGEWCLLQQKSRRGGIKLEGDVFSVHIQCFHGINRKLASFPQRGGRAFRGAETETWLIN